MPILSLTDRSIRTLVPPERGQVTYWDKSLKSFGIRVSQGGSRSWVVMLGLDRRRTTIGRYPLISLSDARRQAKQLIAEETLEKFRPGRKAFGEAKNEYLEYCESKNKPRTVRDYRILLDKYFQFGRRNVVDITPREINRILTRLNSTPSMKHHVFVAGRAFFTWCVRMGYLEQTPMINVVVPSNTRPRERVLSENELKTLLGALIGYQSTFKVITLLCLLTGQRRGEISHLERDWIGVDTITLPSILTKNKRTHTFPIGPMTVRTLQAIPLLDDRYLFPAKRKVSDKTSVFNGWSKPKKSLDLETGVTGWTLHDLRRTLSSNWARLGITQTVTEKYLNHISEGTLSPIAQTYNRHAYMDEMRDAVLKWEDYLSNLRMPAGLSNPGVS